MPGVEATDKDVDIDLGRLFAALWERRRQIAIGVVAAGAAAFLLTSVMDKSYTAESRVLIESRDTVSADDTTTQGGQQPILDERAVASQVEVMKSTDLLKSVAVELNLASLDEFDAAAEPSIISDLLIMAGLKKNPLATPPEERVLKQFRENLTIYQVENSRVIVIEFSSRDPELAAKVPNVIASKYLETQSGAKRETNADATAWLEPEIARLRNAVRASEAKVADYRAEYGLLMVGQEDTLTERELADTATELSRVRGERADAEAKAAAVREAVKDGRDTDTIGAVVESALVQRLRESEVAIQAQLAELSTTLLDGHPRIKALRSQLVDIDRRIREESRKILANLENEASVSRLRERQLVQQMNALKANSARAGGEQVELRALEREASAQRALLETYLARYREAASRSDESSIPADARIISRAIVPTEVSFPKPLYIVPAAMIAAFLIAAIWIMLAELFSGRAMVPAAGRREENTPASAGAVPASASLLAANSDADDNAEAIPTYDFSVVGTADYLIDNDASVVICVSPEGDEGSATTVMLARTVAETGRRTVLVDITGSACPTELMAEENNLPGITELLAGEIAFADTIYADRKSGAHFIPQGNANPRRAMRGIERLPMIVDALADAYDMVIVECGPTDVAGVARLDRHDDAELVVTVVQPDEERMTEVLGGFYEAGFSNLIVMMPGLAPRDGGRRTRDGSEAAA